MRWSRVQATIPLKVSLRSTRSLSIEMILTSELLRRERVVFCAKPWHNVAIHVHAHGRALLSQLLVQCVQNSLVKE